MRSFIIQVYEALVNKELFVKIVVGMVAFVIKLSFCMLLYFLVFKFIKKLNPLWEKRELNKRIRRNKELNSFMSSALKICLHCIMIAICLLIIGVKETSLVAFFGTLGIGVGLALKDNLSNFAGGLIVLFFKTYKIGDEVQMYDEQGFIHSIDIFSTTVRTYGNDLVIIPNGIIVANKIKNFTTTPTRRIKIVIGVSYDADIGAVRARLEKMMRENPLVLTNLDVYTNVEEYADSSINVSLKGWTRNDDYWTVYYQIMNSIKSELDEIGVQIPFPQMDITIKNLENNTIIK